MIIRPVSRIFCASALAIATAAGAATAGGTVAAGSVAAIAAPHGSAPRLGSVPLRACTKRPRTYCGHLMVPLDYASAASPRIRIGFRWLPASGHATGTVLAVEGGPGFATTGTQGAYLAQMGSLKRTRNLLLVNLRGTGNSTVINCPALEHAGSKQYGRRFNRLVAGVRTAAQPHLALPRRRLGARLRPVQHRLHGQGCIRRAARPAPRAGGPVRRLLRKLVLAGLRLPLPGAAAVGDAGLHLPGARP